VDKLRKHPLDVSYRRGGAFRRRRLPYFQLCIQLRVGRVSSICCIRLGRYVPPSLCCQAYANGSSGSDLMRLCLYVISFTLKVRLLTDADFLCTREPAFPLRDYDVPQSERRIACTLLGCLCVVFLPLPFMLIRYGKRIRMKSKYGMLDMTFEKLTMWSNCEGGVR
jgi:hypothetical protein